MAGARPTQSLTPSFLMPTAGECCSGRHPLDPCREAERGRPQAPVGASAAVLARGGSAHAQPRGAQPVDCLCCILFGLQVAAPVGKTRFGYRRSDARRAPFAQSADVSKLVRVPGIVIAAARPKVRIALRRTIHCIHARAPWRVKIPRLAQCPSLTALPLPMPPPALAAQGDPPVPDVQVVQEHPDHSLRCGLRRRVPPAHLRTPAPGRHGAQLRC